MTLTREPLLTQQSGYQEAYQVDITHAGKRRLRYIQVPVPFNIHGQHRHMMHAALSGPEPPNTHLPRLTWHPSPGIHFTPSGPRHHDGQAPDRRQRSDHRNALRNPYGLHRVS